MLTFFGNTARAENRGLMYNIYYLIFTIEIQCVLCDDGTELLYIT